MVPSGSAHPVLAVFMHASPVVQGVMLLLLAASVACWAVILSKAVRLAQARKSARDFLTKIRTDTRAATVAAKGPAALVVSAGVRAWRDDEGRESRAERRERIERAMRVVLGEEMKGLEGGLIFLATVGSTAPFVGLFGTVWGIINSFTAIAASHDTSLAVVAPGIAEALSATALGLVAAIPAVMAYNKFASAIGAIAHQFNIAVAELGDFFARGKRQAQEAAE